MTTQATKQAPVSEEAVRAIAPSSGEEEVAVLAYELWQARGCPEGTPEEDWFKAEKVLAEKAAA